MEDRKINEIQKLLDQLEIQIIHFDTSKPTISKSNVGWHIEHTLLTLSAVSKALTNSNPGDYKWKFNFIRMIVLTMKKIPRGKAKVPEVVRPKENYSMESLKDHLSKTKAKIEELNTISENKYFEHPVFGNIKLKQTIRFLEIHTKHHLDIIKDILKDEG